jgi:hypothetical protein
MKVPAVDEQGTLRVVHQAGFPDTFFSVPAKARIRGEKVFGFVTINEHGVRIFTRGNDQKAEKKAYRRNR